MQMQKLLATTAEYIPYKIRRGLSIIGLDYTAKFSEDAVYENNYSKESLHRKSFYNFGAGSFHHKFWSNIEAPNSYDSRFNKKVDVEYNFTSRDQIPVESGTSEVCYTSHVLEHLRDADVRHIFSEIYRMLKPGGVFRITCPDVGQAMQAVSAKNFDFFRILVGNRKLIYDLDYDVGIAFFVAQQLVISEPGLPVPGYFKFSEFADESNYGEILDRLCQASSDEYQKKNPVHINWWDNAKVIRFLHEAGFTEAAVSSYGKSKAMIMRDGNKFDNTWPQISLYVEAIK